MAKAEALAPGPTPRWHFIGRPAAQQGAASWRPSWTCGRPSTASSLGRRDRPAGARAPRVLVQVNVSGEPQKGGCPPEDAAALVAELRDLGLDVRA